MTQNGDEDAGLKLGRGGLFVAIFVFSTIISTRNRASVKDPCDWWVFWAAMRRCYVGATSASLPVGNRLSRVT